MSVPTPLAFALPWLNCKRCRLHEGRNCVVLGRGNPNADVMFFGEGPGPDEDQLGYPFIGKSGKLLTEYIEERLGWSREDVFIDNVVRCFPHNVVEGTKIIRKPSSLEIAKCRDLVVETIYRVDPLVIVALGATALYGLTGISEAMKSARGGMYFTKVPGFYKHVSYPVIATWHPAYLLRNPGFRKGSASWEFWEDLKFVKKVRDQLLKLYDGRGEWR